MKPWRLLLFLLYIAGCESSIEAVTFFAADKPPDRLSEWRLLFVEREKLHMNDRVMPYDLNTPLFSDYALKLRTVWMPEGTGAVYRSDREFDFPVGTIIGKTFHYRYAGSTSAQPLRVIKADKEATLDAEAALDLGQYFLAETRLLVRYEDGWKAFPYIWNAEQTEAFFEPAGGILRFELVAESGEGDSIAYVVPDRNQCASCHTPDYSTKALRPLGPNARQLNRDYSYTSGTVNQLDYWKASGLLTGAGSVNTTVMPRLARWSDPGDATLEQRARSYLDANCAHCHNRHGAADTSALNLDIDAPLDRHFGICKPPVAVGRGSGNRPYDIYPGKAERSILVFRMENADPAIAMPELGRATSHVEGIAVIRDWINALPGSC
jgi:uncharacterized repeat protein (TIGR03806 family)